MNIRLIIKRLTAVVLLAALAFTSMPMAGGTLSVHAASKITLSASAAGQTGANLKWNKISGAKGYAVFRDGKAIAHLGKSAVSFKDSGLRAGTTHSYQIKAYTKKVKKTKMWKNKYTGAVRKKKPSKKDKKNWKKVKIKKTTYKYSKKSNVRSVTTSSPSSSSNTGTGGNTGSTTPARTKYTCTDYLATSRTLWKDSNGVYWDSQTGGSKITEIQRYDKTKDGKWIQNGFQYSQNNGITVAYKITETYKNPTSEVESKVRVFNGSTNKVRLSIRNQTETVHHGWMEQDLSEFHIYDVACVMHDNGHRLVSYTYEETDPATIRFYTAGDSVSGDGDIYGFDGLDRGTVFVDVYYDNMLIGTMEKVIEPNTKRLAFLSIAQAAIDDNGGSKGYAADMRAIKDYILTNFGYDVNMCDSPAISAHCQNGARVLQTWSLYKYNVGGPVDLGPGAANHNVFYPLDNPYTTTTYYEAQGDLVDRNKKLK